MVSKAKRKYIESKGPGRPEKPIDWNKVDQLLIAGCKSNEVAPHFNMCRQTFESKLQEFHNLTFTAYSAQKKELGDSLLKTKQYEIAMKGDKTLLIWLGKVRLEQKEQQTDNRSPQLDLTNIQNLIIKLQAENDELRARLNDDRLNDAKNEQKTIQELPTSNTQIQYLGGGDQERQDVCEYP